MKTKIIFILLFFCITVLKADEKSPVNDANTSALKIFTKDDIQKLSGLYVNNNVKIENPAIVDVDGDGDFDLLNFNDGNVVYYKNTGTLENPVFILENKNYDSYKEASFLKTGMPMPVFFADKDGDGDLDMFAVNEKGYNSITRQYEYKVYSAENALDLDTGTLITIILILVIVILLLAILR
jgi:hypothetical protein